MPSSPLVPHTTLPSTQPIMLQEQEDKKKKQQPNNRHPYRLPVMLLCAVLGYGLCQLDISLADSTVSIGGGVTYASMSAGKNGKKPIAQISVLGERNSGTRWTTR
jgi:hypothetical protein